MTNKELFKKVTALAEKVNQLAKECGREIHIASESDEFPVWIEIGKYGDGFKEHLDIHQNSVGGWNVSSNLNIFSSDFEDFDMEGKVDGQ